MRLAISLSRWLLAAAVVAIFAFSTPEVSAAPLDPISTEIELEDELGNDPNLDPDIITNYNVDRIEDVDIPGPVPVPLLPPPPGFGPEGRKDIC